MGRKENVILPLTSLRFFAAYYVVLFHYGAGFVCDRVGQSAKMCHALRNGYLGVTFFFVLSGFILVHVYLDKLTLTRSSLKRFFVARVARIFPVYLLMLAWFGLYGGPWVETGWTAVPQFFGLQSWAPWSSHAPANWNSPAWTLSAEVFFYLTFPFLLTVCRKQSSYTLWAALAVTFLVIVFFSTAAGMPMRVDLPGWRAYAPQALVRLPEFVVGVLIGVLYARRRREITLGRWALPALVVLFAALVSASTDPWVSSASVVPLSAIIIATAQSNSRFLSNRLLVFFGGASYSLYIIHEGLHDFISDLTHGSRLGDVAFHPALLVVSALAFLLVEEPARERIRRLVSLKKSAGAEITQMATGLEP